MPRFKPHMSLVNDEALAIIIDKALAFAQSPVDPTLKAAIDSVNVGRQWSKGNRCPACGGAGVGHDGDTWDLADICQACKGMGLKVPDEG